MRDGCFDIGDGGGGTECRWDRDGLKGKVVVVVIVSGKLR